MPWNAGISDIAGVSSSIAHVCRQGRGLLGCRSTSWSRGNKDSLAAPGRYSASSTRSRRRPEGPGVAAYEIWNEPDDGPVLGQRPQPPAYAALLKAAYPAVKSATRTRPS